MSWKTAYRSFYYETAEEPDDIHLDPQTTALLVIDIQNTYLEVPNDPQEAARWQPFFDRMHKTVIPNTTDLMAWSREQGIEVMFARIACQKDKGKDRSLSQKKPGFNYLLLSKDEHDSQIISKLAPLGDESFGVVVVKDCCAAATEALHTHEFEIINMIYCHVVSSDEVKTFIAP